jgi:hypothetical protein
MYICLTRNDLAKLKSTTHWLADEFTRVASCRQELWPRDIFVPARNQKEGRRGMLMLDWRSIGD